MRRNAAGPVAEERAFYRRAMRLLQKHHLPFLVGGAYALKEYTGIERHTKDLDLFIRPADCRAALEILSTGGYRTEVTAAHWLGKAFHRVHFIDFILGFANGLGQVDEAWFSWGENGSVFGVPVRFVAPEEMIWIKSFVQTRDRYDGADVAHLLRACHDRLDWKRLLDAYQSYWRVFLSHLILFGFIYPGERQYIPTWVLDELLRRLKSQLLANGEDRLCQGTLFSATDYIPDILKFKYRDARLLPGTIQALV